MGTSEKLILLPLGEYVGVDHDDPIRQYQKPFFGKYYRRRAEVCLEACRGGDRVLEVGFGTGVAFFNLAKKYRQIYGIDLKSNTQEIAKMYASKGVPVFLRQGNLLELPYEDDFFDTILLISILEHLQPEDLARAFAQIQRVLKPGGNVVYGVPVDNAITRAGFFLLGYDITKHHFSNERQIRNAASSCLCMAELRPLFMAPLGIKIYEVGSFTKE